MHLAVGGAFQPKWTAAIQDEWIRNLQQHDPTIDKQKLKRTRRLMEKHGRSWRVPRHTHLIARLQLPDPRDRHVLAAAIASRAAIIVTRNVRDFPAWALSAYKVRVETPDDFLQSLLSASPGPFVAAVRHHRAAMVRPPFSAREYLAKLASCGCEGTARKLQPYQPGL